MSYTLPTERGGTRFRRALWWGLAASAAFHLALVFIWRGGDAGAYTPLAAGLPAADPVAAAGGGAIQALAVTLTEPEPIEVPAPPERVIEMAEPEIDVTDPVDAAARVRIALSAPTPGDGQHGVPGSAGRGDAGADPAGRSRSSIPSVRTIIPEWDPPDAVRGTRIDFRVLVSERGQPLVVEMVPRTALDEFNRRLLDKVRRMEFVPARRDGEPVQQWTTITMTF